LHSFGECSRIAGASSIYFRSLCLRGSDLGRRLSLCLGFILLGVVSMLGLFMSWFHLMVDDMAIVEMYLIFRYDFLCWDIFMHDYLVIHS